LLDFPADTSCACFEPVFSFHVNPACQPLAG
jgi:hypothetical protein